MDLFFLRKSYNDLLKALVSGNVGGALASKDWTRGRQVLRAAPNSLGMLPEGLHSQQAEEVGWDRMRHKYAWWLLIITTSWRMSDTQSPASPVPLTSGKKIKKQALDCCGFQVQVWNEYNVGLYEFFSRILLYGNIKDFYFFISKSCWVHETGKIFEIIWRCTLVISQQWVFFGRDKS